jgi:hypothetical protein
VSELLIKRIKCAMASHLQSFFGHRTKILALAKTLALKKIFVPRFYAVAREKKSVCPASMQLKISMCPVPFCSGPYKINFAWPLRGLACITIVKHVLYSTRCPKKEKPLK